MLPCSLYIHIPWCIRKCPYCDFNSHKSPDILPETAYIQRLLHDFETDHQEWPRETLTSIFIGGGTPSLFSGDAMHTLLDSLRARIGFAPGIEITLEANPGTLEQGRFRAYRQAGINRLSLGIQSFNAQHLKKLGRIHDGDQAQCAIESARDAGFDNINLDLMHSLPEQTVQQGLDDLNLALSYAPEHLSWYQLTCEPNTVFYTQKPVLPSEDTTEALEQAGFALLAEHGLSRYEISAFCTPEHRSQHNLNYWQFGDYYGIGAGAHGKLGSPDLQHITRTQKHRQPSAYLNRDKPCRLPCTELTKDALRFEFMLNATRLEQPIAYSLFTKRTGLPLAVLKPGLEEACQRGLISQQDTTWQVTARGRRFTNDLQALFL